MIDLIFDNDEGLFADEASASYLAIQTINTQGG